MSKSWHEHGIENPCEGEHEGAEDGRDDTADKDVSNNPSSADVSVRQRVLKEVGFTSSTFIGPAFPPPTSTIKSDIEDTLSEFYKELEEFNTPEDADKTPVTPDADFIPLETTNKGETYQDVSKGKIVKCDETDSYQKGSGKKQPSWPHWYQNEPYYSRRPRPNMDQSSGRAAPTQNQWQGPQPTNRPPNPGFHRPPFLPPPPPQPPPFQNPQDLPSHVNQNWTGPAPPPQFQEKPHFPAFPNFPPPNVCNQPPQGFCGDSQYHFDRDDRVPRCDAHSENVNVGWLRDREEEWCQPGGDYDRRQRCASENEQWEQHHQPRDNNNVLRSSQVLILMRGLPGSGKSTLARELLSTGPSGLILSTDDYFAHRNGYHYEVGLLGAAHEWNQSRANDAMRDGRSPIIIDNTNLQAWEMKPYVKMALDRGYKVDFCEPDTSWKFDPYELEKRNKHGVPQEKIAQMMDRFSYPISVDIVLSSQEPLHVNQRRRAEQPHTRRKNQDFY